MEVFYDSVANDYKDPEDCSYILFRVFKFFENYTRDTPVNGLVDDDIQIDELDNVDFMCAEEFLEELEELAGEACENGHL
jgi:hypothetical protein